MISAVGARAAAVEALKQEALAKLDREIYPSISSAAGLGLFSTRLDIEGLRSIQLDVVRQHLQDAGYEVKDTPNMAHSLTVSW